MYNNCPARNPQDGPCPQGHTDSRECLGDHGCECLAEKELMALRRKPTTLIPIPPYKLSDIPGAINEIFQKDTKRQPKAMTPAEEAEFQAAAKTAGLPCGND